MSASCALAACATADTPATTASSDALESARIERGQHLAVTNCSGCHAIGRSGDSRHPMAPPFRQLSRNYHVNELEEAFAEGVLVGHPDMPEFTLSPEDVDSLLSYIQSVQERRGA
ncbi:MAG: cytochrome c [Hyphomonadaceae bacterium]|nr:cytochrome c [Hyphomonadaceae bacterium]